MRFPDLYALRLRLAPRWFSSVRGAVSIGGGAECSVCGAVLNHSKYGICPSCNSRPRVRSIAPVLAAIEPNLDTRITSRPCLAFSAVLSERKLLQRLFPLTQSVSLFGNYGKEHRTGIDARNLREFPDAAFSAHYSCLLFDYFVEHESALSEAHRVLVPGGVFITHIQHTRLTEGRQWPRGLSTIRPGPGYYEYIPADRHMLNVRVGAQWFLDAMSKAGLNVKRYRFQDGAGVPCDWFVGWKPASS